MAKLKASDFEKMVRSIVREEIQTVVTETVHRILSERYLRQLAESVAISRPRGVASLEQMGDDAIEEPPPHPLENDTRWPFQTHPMKKDDYEPVDNTEDQERDKDNPMSIFFEGTRSLQEIEAAAPTEDDLVTRTQTAPMPKGKEFDNQKRVWTTLAGVKDKKVDEVDPEAKAQFEAARIKRMREELDRKV